MLMPFILHLLTKMFQVFGFPVLTLSYFGNTSPAVRYLRSFYYSRRVDISTGELFVPRGIIRQVVNISALTWFSNYYANKIQKI